jgi:NAD(P)-dependent dehydrogenase (short-subunit alcohol dehydrogenase family)|tara:strand:+ start:13100 stop:13867 length:768 start_codon:yes stop_codon:yes gene_type:complete
MDLTDKVVVVTGGASGIGRAMATRFLAEGARQAVIADVNEEGLQLVAKEIGALAVPTDVSKEADVTHLIRTAEERFGQIDLLCSNAGIGMAGGVTAANESWQRIWEVNVMAHIYAARAALPAMIARGDGYLLNTSSAAGLLTSLGAAPYSVTKHAAVALAEWLSITHGDKGIKVSVLCPLAVRTGMTSSGGGATGEMMEPEELCDCVVEALQKETFLIIPHGEVLTYIRRKTDDYDRWLNGMRRLQQRAGRDDII